MCFANPNCNKKETLIYKYGKIKLFSCECGFERGENPDGESLPINEKRIFDEKYYEFHLKNKKNGQKK